MNKGFYLCQSSLKIFFKKPRRHLGERTTTIFIIKTPFIYHLVRRFTLAYVLVGQRVHLFRIILLKMEKIVWIQTISKKGVEEMSKKNKRKNKRWSGSKQTYGMMLGCSVLLEWVILSLLLLKLSQWLPWVGWICSGLSFSLALWLLGSHKEPAFKLCWYWLLLPFPLVGGLLFLRMGGLGFNPSTKKRLLALEQKRTQMLSDTIPMAVSEHDSDSPCETLLSPFFYLEQEKSFPSFTHCNAQYFSSGEAMFRAMKEYVTKAKKYIFLEYFILADGILWKELRSLLREKREQGVEIRILYDEVGCLTTLPPHFQAEMTQLGIKTTPVHPLGFHSLGKNNRRDHRKMMIVDGIYGFTGGMNLADEYINEKQRFGHWKDSGLLLEGQAVWSMTVLFLTMWEYASKGDENILEFFPKKTPFFQETGVVLPYTDIQAEGESVALYVLIALFGQAKKSIYLTTPYLMLDTALETLLCVAAKNGVDVRIITPSIPDKKLVFQVTRGQYRPLLQAGVQIFEYSQGFVHSKNVIVDGTFAIVGTINLDYRSLFLQFEQGVLLKECACIPQMQADFFNTQEKSIPYTKEEGTERPLQKALRSVLAVFSPLM